MRPHYFEGREKEKFPRISSSFFIQSLIALKNNQCAIFFPSITEVTVPQKQWLQWQRERTVQSVGPLYSNYLFHDKFWAEKEETGSQNGPKIEKKSIIYHTPKKETQLCADSHPFSAIFTLGNSITNNYFQLGL